ncbi:unnamed protein product [Phytophthora lilii]|uniref:Unnamed protein product n=1 Tax=Phytophthora lilii TaxID=2077276 RepID=A0A9W6WSB6_9STRA|nr:unnamed protein product [Phytophthora lilii]
MTQDAAVATLPAMDVAAQAFAFVSWEGSNGRRACPLATFGSQQPQAMTARLACADPPRADQPQLKNAADMRGAIALVVRGGCSFAHKARLLQRAGAVAMLLANNTREEPLAAFTMGESPQELEKNAANGAEPIAMPCVMMCLRDVRELFQKFPPSVKTGVLTFEILESDEGALVAQACLRTQKELQAAAEIGKGWKAIKRTTTSIIKLLEPQNTAMSSNPSPEATSKEGKETTESTDDAMDTAVSQKPQQPLLAFVQWATSASTYEIRFAPLADFCSAKAGASYAGKLVMCDPLLADKPLRNEEQLRGAVALLRRGSCSFPEKLEHVQRAGAIAAIVCNDDEKDLDAAFVMSVDHIDAANATLPAVMISHNSFLRIQTALNVATARILCLAGEAADGLLASSGQTVAFKELPMPSPKHASLKDGYNNETDAQDPRFELHAACREGDHGACQRVLAGVEGKEAKKKLVNSSYPSNGLTALHHACAAGNDNVVELLLQLGAAPDAVDLALQTPLHVACGNSHVNCARLLLRAQASSSQVPTVLYNVDEDYGGLSTRRNIGGGTAMHEAAAANSPECIELLLTANARVDISSDGVSEKYLFLGVNATDLEGKTPLHIACANAHADCALYLVAANADILAKDCSGHSPLLLACEAVNDQRKEADAIQIIEKLILSGATMEEYEVKVNQEANIENARLFVDRIESPDIRRELEVIYLRHEVLRGQQNNIALKNENYAVVRRLKSLEEEIKMLRSVVSAHDSYGHQIQQLQLQMQMILQFQTSYGMQSSSTSIQDSIATPLLVTSLGSTAGKSDEELALDAALARDLGKKCLRQSQAVLAEKYFQRSLDLMPLPGVHRLLDTARKTRQNAANGESSVTNHLATKPYPNELPSSTNVPVPTDSKAATVKHLRELVQGAHASTQARVMLESELSKLDVISDEGEFAVACRWMEWLVTLPWGNPNSGLQNDDLYTMKRNEFRQLDAIDVSRFEGQQNQAARIIQRTFRERYAVHLRTRAVAVARIQAIVRGNLARRHYKSIKQQLLEARKQRVVDLANQQDGMDVVSSFDVDYETTVDSGMHRKLPPRFLVNELIAGIMLPTLQVHVAEGKYVEKKARVVQLVKCFEAKPASHRRVNASESRSAYFVWTRWGADLDRMFESSLSGPYEDVQDAQRRYDRIKREEEVRAMPDKTSLEAESVYESGFDLLKSIVGASSRGFGGSVASA